MDEKQLHKTIEIKASSRPAFIQYVNGVPYDSGQRIETAVAVCPTCKGKLLEFPHGVTRDHATILSSEDRVQEAMEKGIGERCPYCGQALSFDKSVCAEIN